MQVVWRRQNHPYPGAIGENVWTRIGCDHNVSLSKNPCPSPPSLSPSEHSKPLFYGEKRSHLKENPGKGRERLFQNLGCVPQVLGHIFSEKDCVYFANTFPVNHHLSSQGVSNTDNIMVEINCYSPCHNIKNMRVTGNDLY